MQKEAEVIVQITDLASGGSGVAKEESGRVLFIPFTVPGDRVRALVRDPGGNRGKRSYAEATLVEVIEPSSDRVMPRCPAFGRCGGCQWQHVPYDLQWKTKSKGVRDALRRMKIQLDFEPEEIPAEEIWEYRNRVQLRGEGDRLGFFSSSSHRLIPVNRCDIARPEINQAWKSVQEEGMKFNLPYKVELAVQADGHLKEAWNAPHAAGGFRQVHDSQNEKLRRWIVEKIHPQSEILLDLYGGSGNLSLPLSQRMKQIHCVDLGSPQSRIAGQPDHFHFHRMGVVPWIRSQKGLTKGAASPYRDATVILDPPRAGLGRDLEELADAFQRWKIREMIAVGCDPNSFARDLAAWISRGWRLKNVMFIDFFPQTTHIESVALLAL